MEDSDVDTIVSGATDTLFRVQGETACRAVPGDRFLSTRAQTQLLRAKLLRVLQLHFGGEAPPDVRVTVQAQADMAMLDRWFDLASTATTLDDFRTGLNGTTTSSGS